MPLCHQEKGEINTRGYNIFSQTDIYGRGTNGKHEMLLSCQGCSSVSEIIVRDMFLLHLFPPWWLLYILPTTTCKTDGLKEKFSFECYALGKKKRKTLIHGGRKFNEPACRVDIITELALFCIFCVMLLKTLLNTFM